MVFTHNFIHADLCVELKSSTRLQCAHTRTVRTRFFSRASRTRRERSIRPKISRIDVDVTELENFKVWSGRPKPAVDVHTVVHVFQPLSTLLSPKSTTLM